MGSRWRRTGARVCAGALLLQGCYQTVQVQQGVTPVTERVLLTLNDQGRVAMADKLGPSVDKVEGVVSQVRDDVVYLNVIRVTHIGGGSSLWNGERVSIQKGYVGGFAERHLSVSRTVLLAGGIAIGMAAFILTRSLLLGGGGIDDPTPGGGGQGSLRIAP